MLWLVVAAIYLAKQWKVHSAADVAMLVLSALATLAIMILDDFFAR
jgi:hypothetical protein